MKQQNKNNSNSQEKLPSLKAISWAEEIQIRNLTRISSDVDAIPSYVIQKTLENIQYEEKLPQCSEKIYLLCKQILLRNKDILNNETIGLAVYMVHHLEKDLHNMAAHRFSRSSSFPSFLKMRGIEALSNPEQKVFLLRGLQDEENIHKTLQEEKLFESSLLEENTLAVSELSAEAQALIAHKTIPETVMEGLCKADSLIVRQSLAYNPDTPVHILKTLQESNTSMEDETLAAIIASHSNTDVETLNKMLLSNPCSKAAKIITSSRTSLNLDDLFDDYSSMRNTPWNGLRGIAANRSISHNTVFSFLDSEFINDFETVYNLLSNKTIDGAVKELLKSAVEEFLTVY